MLISGLELDPPGPGRIDRPGPRRRGVRDDGFAKRPAVVCLHFRGVSPPP